MISDALATILVALVGLDIGAFLVLSYRISSKQEGILLLQEKYSNLKKEKDELHESYTAFKDRMYDKINNLQQLITDNNRVHTDLRNQDNIKFTEALGKFNLTLSKFDGTLQHFDKTLTDVNNNLRREIDKLDEKIEKLAVNE